MPKAGLVLAAVLLSSTAQAQMQVYPGWYQSGTPIWRPGIPFPPVVVAPPPLIVQPPVVVAPPVVCAAVGYGPPLNLRTWPNGPIIAAYWAGTRVVSDWSDGGRWVHVVIGPVAGWMFAPYLVPIPCGT